MTARAVPIFVSGHRPKIHFTPEVLFMMKRFLFPFSVIGLFFVLACGVAVSARGAAAASPAPNFTATDSHGKKHSLSDFKGKYVVLEWVNYDCPFVVRHYKGGDMQALQKKYAAKGVVWLSINSSASGKQGHFTNEEVNARMKERHAAVTAYLIDTDGAIGKMYGAKTTPHMFVINPKGEIIYQGAIDDTPSTDPAQKAGVNYVEAALDAALAGKAVPMAATKPYGCSVKYQN
jgi:peroxiredoxin